MKIHFSLPKDEGFFHSYVTLTPTLYRLGFLAQVISALTEIGIIYSLIYSALVDIFAQIAHPAALFGAIVGTAFLEVGLRKFTPYSFRAILYGRFAGLHLVMSTFIFTVTIGLLLSSSFLSFKGSRDLVEAVAPAPQQKSTAFVDSLHHEEAARITNRFETLGQATKEKYDALVNVQQLDLKKYEDRERRTDRSYVTRKNRIRKRIAELEAQRAGEIRDLETEKAALLAKAEDRRLQGRRKIEIENDSVKADVNRKVSRYGNGLAWFTIICIFVFVLSVALDEVHKKGSGIECKALPNQYHFSQSVIGELISMLSDKWNYFTRSWILKQAGKTPPPPQPAAPPLLFDIQEWSMRRKELSFQTEDGYEKEVDLKHQFDNQDYASLFEEAITQNGNGEANGASADENRSLHYNNALHYEKPSEVITVVKEVDKSTKPCEYCGGHFKPRTTWQKYCSSDCREAFHAAKHGEIFDPKKYHKTRKKRKKRN